MKLIRDLSGEEKVRFGLVFVLCKLWVENPVSIIVIKEHRVVIKLVLYDKYISESFLGFPGLCNKNANLFEVLGCFGTERKKGKTGGVGGPEGYCPF